MNVSRNLRRHARFTDPLLFLHLQAMDENSTCHIPCPDGELSKADLLLLYRVHVEQSVRGTTGQPPKLSSLIQVGLP